MADGPRWQYDVSRLMNLLERIRAGESHAEAAPPIDMAALAGDVPATSASHASAADTDTERDAARRKAETIRARVASAHQPAGSGHSGGRHRPRVAAGSAESGSGGRKPSGLSDAPRWLLALAGLGVVAVLALALFGAYQLGNDRSGSSASTQPAGPGTVANAPTTGTSAVTNSTDVPANADADQSKLWLAIPKPIRRGSCKFADSEHAGGVATINCDYDDPKHGRTLVHLDRFVDFAHLQVIYKLQGPVRWRRTAARRTRSSRRQREAATGRCGEAKGHGATRQAAVSWGPSAVAIRVTRRRSMRPRQEDEPDRCQWLDLLRDRLDGPRCHHVREGRAADECARRNRVLLRFWHHQFG